MIKSFRDKGTESIFRGRGSRAVSEQATRKALRKMKQLDSVESLEEMRFPPGNRLHKLHGDREGQWAVSVDDQYRICFRFEDGHAYDVEATDYH